jgi:hypothetical protein
VLAATAGLLLTSTSALAGKVDWTITPVTGLSGSFTFDADTGTYSSISIEGLPYHYGDASVLDVRFNTSEITQIFESNLTNSGGTVVDQYTVNFLHLAGTTTVVGVAESAGAPEPGSILLGGSGGLALALLRMRRRLAK